MKKKQNVVEKKLSLALEEKKIVQSAYDNIFLWLNEEKYVPLRKELIALINQDQWQLLNDAFYTVIPFGTGGRRGTVGVGSNRVNEITIGESAQGLCNYLKRSHKKSVVIAYDTRIHSKDFAHLCAAIFATNEFVTYIFDEVRSTPELSFAIRHLKAHAGVVISASHNQPSDNGFKAYGEDGGQIVPPFDNELMDEVARVTNIAIGDFSDLIATRKIQLIGKEIDDAYLNAVLNESISASRSATIVYSPLHGAGTTNVLPVLSRAGFSNVYPVTEQTKPDGNFTTIKNNMANPELPETGELAIQYAEQYSSDCIITTDPDADRIGVFAKDNNSTYQFLSGNTIIALLTQLILERLSREKKLTAKDYIAKTIVTTDLMNAIAQQFNITIYDHLLIGFKYVGALVKEKELTENFIFGGEESHGVLKGIYARDKDGAVGALLIAELASELKDKNSNIISYLYNLYRTHGLYRETLTTFIYDGAKGAKTMANIMRGLRDDSPEQLHTLPIIGAADWTHGIHGMTGDVIAFYFSKDRHNRITIRPSGTEPKIKIYTQLYEPLANTASDDDIQIRILSLEQKAQKIVDSLKQYCARYI